MKKLLFLLLVLTSGRLSAQFGGGLSVGFNPSQIDGDGVSGYYKAGLSVGGFLRLPADKPVGVQLEMLYDQLGSNEKTFPIAKMSYISFPLLLSVRTPVQFGADEHIIDFHGGLVPGYLISAKDSYDADISGRLNRMDLRGAAGITYKFAKSVSFTARFAHSLVPFAKGSGAGILYVQQTGPWHRYFTFALRVHFK